jgi:TolB-like protein/Flp pilus assembly protein TadD
MAASMMSWWERIMRRKMVQWAIAYLTVAAIVIGVISDLAQGFSWVVVPLRIAVAILAVGFLAVLVLAWFHGERGRQRPTRLEVLGVSAVWIAASGPTEDPTHSSDSLRSRSRAVAVLPCESMTSGVDEYALGDRWTEELIGKLARVKDLRPKESSSVARYRETRKTAGEIGTELNAGTLVRCRVMEGPHFVRIALELVRADDESLMWSERYEEPAGPDAVNMLQTAAARGIALALGVEPLVVFAQSVGRPMTQDTAALRLYRTGRHFMALRGESGYRRSIEHFRSAIASDSAFAHAYVNLAWSMLFLAEYMLQSSREFYPEAARLVRRAIELDADIPDAHTWLGIYLHEYAYDRVGAEQSMLRALQLDPGSAEVRTWYGWHLLNTERLDESIVAFEEATTLDPLAFHARLHLARSLAFARQLNRARYENHLGWELAPHSSAAFAHNEAIILLLSGKPDSAVAILEENPNPTNWLNGPLYGFAGRPDITRSILDSLVARAELGPVDPLSIAVQHIGVGDNDQALIWLERAYAERSGLLIYLLGSHVFADPLRSDPRFMDLRRRLGFSGAS